MMVGEDKFLLCFGRGNIYLREKLLLTYFAVLISGSLAGEVYRPWPPMGNRNWFG